MGYLIMYSRHYGAVILWFDRFLDSEAEIFQIFWKI